MSKQRTKWGAAPAPITYRELAVIERYAANPKDCYDNSDYIARMRQLERDVLRLAAELRRWGLVVQETML